MRGDAILVVDDSPTEQKLVVSALLSQGFKIITAADGDEALAKITVEKPKLVVLDVVMPKKNGYQVCRALKTGEATKDIKVVLLTSKDQESDKFWGMKQGADAYMTKPFKSEDLVTQVHKLI
jgi:twitching motility two-component system response regulator PilH